MLVIPLVSVLLFVRWGHAVLDEIICHDDLIQRKTPNLGTNGGRDAQISDLMERAFQPGLTPRSRGNMAAFLLYYNFPATLTRLFARPQPLEHPMTVAECLDAVSLIPDASPHLDPNNAGTNTHINLVYPDTQRHSVLQHRLDAIFVAGNCGIRIIRRPHQDPNTNGLQHADATAMALVVYPHAREKALAVIQQCLSGEGRQRQYRFGYVGTKSVLKGLDFEYVVAVTLSLGVMSLANPGEHFYNHNGEIQAPDDDARGYRGATSFPFDHAFY